jgi:anti-sigma B factor antagonist
VVISGATLKMSISYQDVGTDLRRITISGRLDAEGTESILPRLMELVEEPARGVVVELSAVRFLASVGIRALVVSAKAVQQRGGKMVLVTGQGSSVSMSIDATGIGELIPVFTSIAEAEVAALS